MFISLLLLILLGVDWASGYAIAGFVMRHGVSPYGYAFWQSVGPFCCILLIQFVRRDLAPTRGSFFYSAASGIIGIAIPNLLVYFALRYIGSGILTILANTTAIFVYPLAILFNQERFSILRCTFVISGVIGMFLLIIPNSHVVSAQLFEIRYSYWLYLALCIPFCYAFTAVYIARFRPITGNALNYAMWMLFVSALFVTPFSILEHDFYYLKVIDLNSWLICIEVVLSTIGYVLLFVLVHRVGPVYYSLVNTVAAVAGVFYGKLIFGQYFSVIAYFAIAIIVAAILGLSYLHQGIRKYNAV